MYIIQDKETGTFIDSFKTLKEAEAELNAYEKEDVKNDAYTEDFYEIKEVKMNIDNISNFYNRFIEMQEEGASQETFLRWIEILLYQYKNRIEKDILKWLKQDIDQLFKDD